MLKFLLKVKITLVKRERERERERERRERAIATTATKDICDTRSNIDVNHMKNNAKKPGNQLYYYLSKDTRERSNSQSNTCTKNASINGDTQQQQENVLRPPKKSAFIVGDSMIKKIDGYLLTNSINHKLK